MNSIIYHIHRHLDQIINEQSVNPGLEIKKTKLVNDWRNYLSYFPYDGHQNWQQVQYKAYYKVKLNQQLQALTACAYSQTSFKALEKLQQCLTRPAEHSPTVPKDNIEHTFTLIYESMIEQQQKRILLIATLKAETNKSENSNDSSLTKNKFSDTLEEYLSSLPNPDIINHQNQLTAIYQKIELTLNDQNTKNTNSNDNRKLAKAIKSLEIFQQKLMNDYEAQKFSPEVTELLCFPNNSCTTPLKQQISELDKQLLEELNYLHQSSSITFNNTQLQAIKSCLTNTASPAFNLEHLQEKLKQLELSSQSSAILNYNSILSHKSGNTSGQSKTKLLQHIQLKTQTLSLNPSIDSNSALENKDYELHQKLIYEKFQTELKQSLPVQYAQLHQMFLHSCQSIMPEIMRNHDLKSIVLELENDLIKAQTPKLSSEKLQATKQKIINSGLLHTENNQMELDKSYLDTKEEPNPKTLNLIKIAKSAQQKNLENIQLLTQEIAQGKLPDRDNLKAVEYFLTNHQKLFSLQANNSNNQDNLVYGIKSAMIEGILEKISSKEQNNPIVQYSEAMLLLEKNMVRDNQSLTELLNYINYQIDSFAKQLKSQQSDKKNLIGHTRVDEKIADLSDEIKQYLNDVSYKQKSSMLSEHYQKLKDIKSALYEKIITADNVNYSAISIRCLPLLDLNTETALKQLKNAINISNSCEIESLQQQTNIILNQHHQRLQEDDNKLTERLKSLQIDQFLPAIEKQAKNFDIDVKNLAKIDAIQQKIKVIQTTKLNHSPKQAITKITKNKKIKHNNTTETSNKIEKSSSIGNKIEKLLLKYQQLSQSNNQDVLNSANIEPTLIPQIIQELSEIKAILPQSLESNSIKATGGGNPITTLTTAITCSMGIGSSTYMALRVNVLAGNKPSTNITDCAPIMNHLPFPGCNNPLNPLAAANFYIPPYACIPATSPYIPTKSNILLQGSPVNHTSNCALCQMAPGGIIKFGSPAQNKTLIK